MDIIFSVLLQERKDLVRKERGGDSNKSNPQRCTDNSKIKKNSAAFFIACFLF